MAREDDTRKQAREAQRAAQKLRLEAEDAEKAAEKLLNVTSGSVAGFADFVREQGVIGLAVGLVIGAAAGATVKQIVEGLINPAIALLVGSQESLMAATWHVQIGSRSAEFAWGAVVSSLITLLATAMVIYWVVKIAKLDRLDKKKE